MFYIFIGLVIILASKYFFPDLTRYLLYFILIVLSGCLHIICGFWPSSPSHLAGKKHSILSKTRLRAHYCLGISRLLLRWLLKYNFSVIINDTTISKTKIWPLTTCCVCSPLGGRRDEGQKQHLICKQPDKTINIKY
jgi:hypothetical protein